MSWNQSQPPVWDRDRRLGELNSLSLHAEMKALHRAIVEIGRLEQAGPVEEREGEGFSAALTSQAERAASTGLAELARRSLPTGLTKRLEKIHKKLQARKAGSPRSDLGRDLLELIDPLGRAGWAEELLAGSLASLPGVGPKRADRFARRGLLAISELLFWLPTRYEDRRRVVGVGDLEVGRSSTFLAEVKVVDWTATRRGGRFGKIFQAVVGDHEAVVTLKWFRGGEMLAGQMVKGRWLLVSGEVRRYRFSKELIHPEIEWVPAPGKTGLIEDDLERAEFGRIVPIYATPEGMNPRTLRRLIEQSVDAYADLTQGYLPEELVAQRQLPSVPDALRALHRPNVEIDVDQYEAFASPAHERLVLEELYLLELGLAMRRAQGAQRPGIAIDSSRLESRTAALGLPFQLTLAQRRVVGEILADLGRSQPMNRLVQGDVGSGKTVVAILAAVAVSACGGQTALMAPTELLAEQHFRSLTEMVEHAGDGMSLRIGLLTASRPQAEIKALRGRLARGELDLVVGTHALLQGEVVFQNLILSIVDEQHRFGVMQRAALSGVRPDGRFPHRLVMTATPIPRSLAMTAYGELDLSVIDELPPGREPIETILLRAGEGQRVMDLMRETLDRGEQIFVVYPLVQESEKLDLRSAMESAEQIARAFPLHRVDLVHGRLDAAERQAAMERFGTGGTSILVATTVIEVGVDVRGATLMVIEHAERFGLAQLHQLRGRVGRGNAQGRCVLVSRGSSEKSEARLSAMIRTGDGFEIADADLEIRGPGDFLGTRQSGRLPELRIADLLRDVELLAVARQAARRKVETDPSLAQDRDTRRAVRTRWGRRIDLASVG